MSPETAKREQKSLGVFRKNWKTILQLRFFFQKIDVLGPLSWKTRERPDQPKKKPKKVKTTGTNPKYSLRSS